MFLCFPTRGSGLAPLLLGLLAAGAARAQVFIHGASAVGSPTHISIREGPSWPPIPDPLYYLDGQRLDSIGSLSPDTIAKIDLLKGAAAQAFAPDAMGRGIVFFTSKRRQGQAATRAFTERVHQLERQYESAPAGPAAQLPGVRYYLNGQPVGRAAVDTIDGRRVQRYRTLQGQQAARFAHDPAVTEVFLIEVAAAPVAAPTN